MSRYELSAVGCVYEKNKSCLEHLLSPMLYDDVAQGKER